MALPLSLGLGLGLQQLVEFQPDFPLACGFHDGFVASLQDVLFQRWLHHFDDLVERLAEELGRIA